MARLAEEKQILEERMMGHNLKERVICHEEPEQMKKVIKQMRVAEEETMHHEEHIRKDGKT